ncbi:MAG: virulence protein [Rikenellaceae bacterium]|nr:virulence protein [Rikenellaceae bacterium]
MYAIAFDMIIDDLKDNYGKPYNNSYFEIKTILREFDFFSTQGGVYLTENNDMANLYRAINALKAKEWFRRSVRDIRVFRVEDWSDFTAIVKED